MSENPQRAVPYYCPFCAGEDLWPAAETHGQWECRTCARVFAVRFVGLAAAPLTTHPRTGTGATPVPEEVRP